MAPFDLSACLEAVRRHDQEAARLLIEQESVKEISALTGWSATLVKVRAFRARHKLRRLAMALEQEVPNE